MKAYTILMLIIASLLASACGLPAAGSPAGSDAPPTGAPAGEAAGVASDTAAGAGFIPAEALMNATYSGIYDEPITLTGGLYEGEPFAEEDPARPVVEYVDGVELYGDLDGDGVDDAVVFLIERGGGSGAFTTVAAQLNRDGQPVDGGAVRIEDRIGVRSAAVEDGQIALEIITQGPGDAACCSTHKARKTYALQEGKLAETTREAGDLVRVSPADLHGTRWTLLELAEDQPALPDSEATLSFADGQISGSGGCNSYSGSFSLDEANPFVMTAGPLAATRKACPDPVASQESAYFAALENTSRWGYAFGKLALYYAGGQDGEGRLLFAPQAAAESGQGVATAPAGDYTAASSISKDGFARDGEQMRGLNGQVVKLWGFVDHGNMYGDDGAKAILGDWWSGEGPDASTWRFNLKANAGDAVGQSFAVHVPNDPGRDELLKVFLADARAQNPTKVFVTGKLFTFDAPANTAALTGLYVELSSSRDIQLENPGAQD